MDKTALFKLSYGLYVIGVKNENSKFGGCIVDALGQISSGTPARISVSCMKNNNTPAMIQKNGEFTVSVLGENVNPFVVSCFGFQSSKDVDKWQYINHKVVDGLPVIDDSIAYLRCKVESVNEYDTHILFIATVEDAWNGIDAAPQLYAEYHTKLKSRAAAAFSEFKATGKAPVFNSQPSEENEDIKDKAASSNSDKWVCPLCGYIYDGETPFEELSDDWVCPLCGAPKNLFEKQ